MRTQYLDVVHCIMATLKVGMRGQNGQMRDAIAVLARARMALLRSRRGALARAEPNARARRFMEQLGRKKTESRGDQDRGLDQGTTGGSCISVSRDVACGLAAAARFGCHARVRARSVGAVGCGPEPPSSPLQRHRRRNAGAMSMTAAEAIRSPGGPRPRSPCWSILLVARSRMSRWSDSICSAEARRGVSRMTSSRGKSPTPPPIAGSPFW